MAQHKIAVAWGLVGAALVTCVLQASYFAHATKGRDSIAVAPHCAPASGGMVRIPAGITLIGEGGDGRSGRRQHVDEFWIDRHEVTNRQFAVFTAATGHVTTAEREGGGAVFVPPEAIASSKGPASWWRFVKGANWRHPGGPDTSIDDLADHPVVQVSFDDAQAYARWADAGLPSEDEWERAVRGALRDGRAPSASAHESVGFRVANTWQGSFPTMNTRDDGFVGTAPVGCFPPNDFGLFDMIGNVWEWTAGQPDASTRIVRGGSYLCSLDYCANARPAGSQVQEAGLPTSHVGFRTVRRRR